MSDGYGYNYRTGKWEREDQMSTADLEESQRRFGGTLLTDPKELSKGMKFDPKTNQWKQKSIFAKYWWWYVIGFGLWFLWLFIKHRG